MAEIHIPDAPAIPGATHVHSGKVRDLYRFDDGAHAGKLLMVASDRLSAFDVVMKAPVPGKGRLLTQMALFWFEHLKGIVPNHLTGEAPESVVAPDEVAQVQGRAMLVKRLKPLPCEAVVRGYVEQPIFTPATKAAVGDHDENISFEQLAAKIGAPRAAEVRDTAIALYRAASAYALTRGIVIADTKFEFGLDEAGRLTLMDEALTPDSSRFWLADELKQGRIVALDKQPLRDWLASTGVTGGAEQAALDLPDEVILGIHERYARAHRMLCGGDE